MYITSVKITNTFVIPEWTELVTINSSCSVQFFYALNNRSNCFLSNCTCNTITTFSLENVCLKTPHLPGLKSWGFWWLFFDCLFVCFPQIKIFLKWRVQRFSLSYLDGCSPAQGQPPTKKPAVMVNFLLFPLQCRINVLSSLCGVFDFPQNGLFLQNSPGAQTILFWWALHVLFMVITLTSLISDEISCAYFVLFMSLILLLVFPPFFPVACLFIWKTFILHHFKDKRWNTAACIPSNLAEYTVTPSNFLSSVHLFVS